MPETLNPAALAIESLAPPRNSRDTLRSVAVLATTALVTLAVVLPVEYKIIDSIQTACTEPSDDDFAAVDTLMADSLTGNFNPLRASSLEADGTPPSRKDVASQFGLTILSMPDGYFTGNESIDQAIALSNKQLEKYGITMKLSDTTATVSTGSNASPNRDLSSQSSPLSRQDVEKRSTVQAVEQFTWQVSNVPAELIAYSGLKQIQLVKMNGSISAVAQENEHAINFDPSTPISPQLFEHELSHGIDAKQCYNIHSDSALRSLNPDGLYGDTPMPVLTDVLPEPNIFQDIPKLLVQPGQTESSVAELVTIAVVEQYGRTNEAEDKATIGAQLLDTSRSSLSVILKTNDIPVLHAKYRLLAARLYSVLPAVATYLLSGR